MKNILQKLSFTILTLLFSAYGFAQDRIDIQIDENGIDIDKHEWYENPMYWIIGGIILLLIILLISRSSRAKRN